MSFHLEGVSDKYSSDTFNENEFNYDLTAIVDIGLNGIRFSVSSTSDIHARILPCRYKDRAAISLFDTQNQSLEQISTTSRISDNLKKNLKKPSEEYDENSDIKNVSQFPNNTNIKNLVNPSKAPNSITHDDSKDFKVIGNKNSISETIIHDVVYALLRFKSVCKDFKVPKENICIVATEAIYDASNLSDFCRTITNATGWEISIVSKSEEAMLKAYGVASSFNAVQGLIMDLGGGSTQISWISCIDGDLKISDNPVSLPYGSAALTRRLNRCSSPTSNELPTESVNDILNEIKIHFREAISSINIPEDIFNSAIDSGGFKLYVSGGGYRGLGSLLLSREEFNSTTIPAHSSPYSYPIPIINGYACTCKPLLRLIDQFNPLNSHYSVLDFARNNSNLSIFEHGSSAGGKTKAFKVSERRANQLPSVILLVKALLNSFPPIRKVLFSQDGIREGVLFQRLSKDIRMQDPLIVATRLLRPKSSQLYLELLKKSIPVDDQNSEVLVPHVIHSRLLPALVNTAFAHSSFPKELQPLSALNIAILGALSDTHGLSHEVRILLGLALCQRWGGELPDPVLRENMISILSTRKLAWWALYCGHIMHVVGGVYPGGTIHDDISHNEIFSINASFSNKPHDIKMNFDGNKNSRSGLKKTSDTEYIEEILIRIRASKSSPQTAAPMVRNRINNLEKKFKKLLKEFGKTESFKVYVEIDWF
ncbi:uncharacterized protein SAPINGB_P003850 [Magnusiomyces paraingens]|uniref:Ppx/GppA phosphatase domain-containing protein n=1 Tax=Magnusiomyces paraingens TaxID=2606893 RepID=A0A5E8BWW1_9ASCO|nr:uncharacterized protein SAPINGB_P003850 [Saprochaete ingens]VVT53987.1 unnamed protein product [Saprochaete ingens]